MPTVVDASCLSAMLLNEDVPVSVRQFLETLSDAEVVVPALWFWEVANSSHMAARRARTELREVFDQLSDLRDLNIVVDDESVARAWTTSIALADQHRLTVYDAAYLELAIRRSLPLATLDKALARAARAEGTELIGG